MRNGCVGGAIQEKRGGLADALDGKYNPVSTEILLDFAKYCVHLHRFLRRRKLCKRKLPLHRPGGNFRATAMKGLRQESQLRSEFLRPKGANFLILNTSRKESKSHA
jgi:hypothetical protein